MLLAAAGLIGLGATIDRVAIVVGREPILASAIDQEIRVTAFLNRESPDLSAASKKKAANRLIDQALIRQEVRTGGYAIAPAKETSETLAEIEKGRFQNQTQYREALARAGITDAELRDRLAWQLTVLRFIDARFRPGVQVSDEDARKYYDAHRAQFKGSFDDARAQIVDVIAGGLVNQALEDWLASKRKEARIEFLEKALQ
jgi:peptidyl-prolyl cis-trans isomerase SurA